MITYIYGDLFQSPAKVLVNTVNTVGVMGKGIAYDFKRIYPEMFKQYQNLCERKQFDIGMLWIYKTPHKWILNFPTKKHWRHKSKPEYIKAGLKKFVDTYDQKGITSISFPQLGCGNGELDWETEVQPIMETYLSKVPINIFIHIYQKSRLIPEHKDITQIRTWLHGEPETLAFEEFWSDLQDVVTQKSHFMTLDTGQPFSVRYENDSILINTSEGTSKSIPEEGLLEIWQFIRTAGYVMPQKLPYGMDQYASYVISLLAEIHYLHPVKMALKNQDTQIGLHLIPANKDKKMWPEQTLLVPEANP